MTESSAEFSYRALAREPRYAHYARIPARVCACLEQFGAACDRREVSERLLAYYLFIGVADDAIDSRGPERGREILALLARDDGAARGGVETPTPVALAVERLRRHMTTDVRARVLALLGELYGAVVGERRAPSLAAYVEERRRVGRLTAEVSYVLVEPLVTTGAGAAVRDFLARVGEVGCLLDSLVDLRADARSGALGFTPTARDRLTLARRAFADGARLLLARPRLAPLFLAAVADIVRDRRARGEAAEARFEPRAAAAAFLPPEANG